MNSFSNTQDIQNIGILVAASSYLIYEKRPRGEANLELVEIRKSTIPGANLGLFAKSYIAEGSVIGKYPGYVRTLEQAMKKSNKFNLLYITTTI